MPERIYSFKIACKYCGGRVESKGVRNHSRRYRCTHCKRNQGSVLLTDAEIQALRKKDKQIGDLTLTQRQNELRSLDRKKYPYCLLVKFDPKWKSN